MDIGYARESSRAREPHPPFVCVCARAFRARLEEPHLTRQSASPARCAARASEHEEALAAARKGVEVDRLAHAVEVELELVEEGPGAVGTAPRLSDLRVGL